MEILRKMEVTNYVQGVKEGPSGTWSLTDCSPRGTHGNYVNGKKEGTWFQLFSFGHEGYASDTYVNDKRQGPHSEWNEDGSPKGCHGEYANDKQVGMWTCYKYDGTTYTETYVEGVKQ